MSSIDRRSRKSFYPTCLINCNKHQYLEIIEETCSSNVDILSCDYRNSVTHRRIIRIVFSFLVFPFTGPTVRTIFCRRFVIEPKINA